jgi:DNA-directed RNA polymerase subunit RPC12/RpoP
VAEALTEGKAIRIEGGNVILKLNRYRCINCGTLWEAELVTEETADRPAVSCPECQSERFIDFARQAGWQPRGSRGKGLGGPGHGRRGRGGGKHWNP